MKVRVEVNDRWEILGRLTQVLLPREGPTPQSLEHYRILLENVSERGAGEHTD